ncbi:LLM class flavin-dependent oxidoreductase [Actinoplanes sp. NPDC048796]|uniref:LLM class flavin-dependent oxidoreductase n=1 Tax=unclassified Actinoplanes TaxID=2626549 RepID=UPI0033D32880
MRVGLMILPATSWDTARAQWRRAEELGFAHAWTYDHVVWRDMPDRPWFAATPTLAAAAAATSTLPLGTLVATPNFRHPVVLAKEAMTLDDISGGRFVLGVGAGGGGADARVLGNAVPLPRARQDRFEEFVELLDLLLRQPVTSYRGRHYQADEVHMLPGCRRRPRMPIAVAAGGPRGIRLAAAVADIWITNGTVARPGLEPPVTTPEVVAGQVRQLRDACARRGRDPDGVRRLLNLADRDRSPFVSVDAFAETVQRYAAAGITDLVVPYPRAEPPFAGSTAVLERVAAEVLPALQTATSAA